ncbi:hypothetical protein Tco_1319462 [Tanacetum coccineum]
MTALIVVNMRITYQVKCTREEFRVLHKPRHHDAQKGSCPDREELRFEVLMRERLAYEQKWNGDSSSLLAKSEAHCRTLEGAQKMAPRGRPTRTTSQRPVTTHNSTTSYYNSTTMSQTPTTTTSSLVPKLQALIDEGCQCCLSSTVAANPERRTIAIPSGTDARRNELTCAVCGSRTKDHAEAIEMCQLACIEEWKGVLTLWLKTKRKLEDTPEITNLPQNKRRIQAGLNAAGNETGNRMKGLNSKSQDGHQEQLPPVEDQASGNVKRCKQGLNALGIAKATTQTTTL